MTIGGGIALVIIGAILAYAVEIDLGGFDLRIAGYILMLGGIVGVVVGLIQYATASRGRTTVVEEVPAQRVVREYDQF